jgi:hypothetical protein
MKMMMSSDFMISELPAVLGAGHERRHVQSYDAPTLEHLRHVAVHYALGETLGYRRLAHARLADQHGVVFLAAGQNLGYAFYLPVAADDGVELLAACELGQVASEVVQSGRFGLFAFARERRWTTAPYVAQFLGDLLVVHLVHRQDLRRHALLVAQEGEQEVPRVYLARAEGARLGGGLLQRFLRARGKRQLAHRDRPAGGRNRLLDGRFQLLDVYPEVGQHVHRAAGVEPDHAEQDVLGPDVVVPEPGRFSPRQLQRFPRRFRKLFLHRVRLCVPLPKSV